jgi:hypothetical protein
MKNKLKGLQKRYEFKKFKIEQPVLDIGGGDGTFLKSQGIKKATILEGCDAPKSTKYEYVKADLTKKLPNLLSKTKWKTIFIMETLEHLPNPLYLLSQVYELLDKNGTCYISIPYTEIGPEHHHVNRWEKNEILNQTRKLGFYPKVIQSRRRFKGFGFLPPHCWLVLSLKKVKNESNKRNIEGYKLNLK